jgi:hypothetical protein
MKQQGWKQLYEEILIHNIIMVIKYRRIRAVKHVQQMLEARNINIILDEI